MQRELSHDITLLASTCDYVTALGFVPGSQQVLRMGSGYRDSMVNIYHALLKVNWTTFKI